jgi:hypothetical protein
MSTTKCFGSLSLTADDFDSMTLLRREDSMQSLLKRDASWNQGAFDTLQLGMAEGCWAADCMDTSDSGDFSLGEDIFEPILDWTSSSEDDASDMASVKTDARAAALEQVQRSGRYEQPDAMSCEAQTWMASVETSIQEEGEDCFVPVSLHAAATKHPAKDAASIDTPSSRAPTMAVKPRLRRRKFGAGSKHSLGGRPIHLEDEGHLTPIALTPEVLRTCFGMPLHEAARTLGICATAVKKCCRKMGIKQWPFQRVKPIQTRLAKIQSCVMTPELKLEMEDLLAQQQALLQGRDLECLNSP